jgi:hypothetical protein
MAEDQRRRGLIRRPLWRIGIIFAALPLFAVIRGEMGGSIFPLLLIGCGFGVALLAGLILTRASAEDRAAAKEAERADQLKPVRSRILAFLIAAGGIALVAAFTPPLFSDDSSKLLFILVVTGVLAAAYGVWSFIVGPRQPASNEGVEDSGTEHLGPAD